MVRMLLRQPRLRVADPKTQGAGGTADRSGDGGIGGGVVEERVVPARLTGEVHNDVLLNDVQVEDASESRIAPRRGRDEWSKGLGGW